MHLDVDRVVEPSGMEVEREIVRHPGAAVLLPVTADGRVILIRQFRYAAGEIMLEVPAGTIDPGETPEETAGRELVEETGYHAGRLEKREASPDADESLELVELPWERALALEPGKDVRDAKTIVALSFLRRHPLFTTTGLRPSGSGQARRSPAEAAGPR